MPVRVERADDAGRLVEVRARRAVGDDAGGAAQPELERDVAQRERLAAPVDERDRPVQVEPVEAPRLGRTGVDQPRLEAVDGGHAAHRGRLEAMLARLEPAALEAPAVDAHLLDRHVLEADGAELLRRVLGGRAVLGRAGGAEAERARTEAGEVLDGRAQLRLVDRELARTREGIADAWRVGGKTRHAERPGPSMRRPYLRRSRPASDAMSSRSSARGTSGRSRP